MEVRVESAAGYDVPPGCFVGVRLGSVLKQGRYEPSRSYNFPAQDKRRNAKVDIYRHVGSCSVAIEPDAQSSHEVQVVSSDPTLSEMKFKISVQGTRIDKAKEREVKATEVKSKAKDYLSKYSIEEKLSDAVKALLKEQPADPTAFLCKILMEGSSLPSSPVFSRKSKADLPKGKPDEQVGKEKNGFRTIPAASLNSLYSQFPAAADRLQPTNSVPLPISPSKQKRDSALSGKMGLKPFKEYYAANALPWVAPQSMKTLFSQFPAAAEHLDPAADAPLPKKQEMMTDQEFCEAMDKALQGDDSKCQENAAFNQTPSVGTWLARPLRS
jgi:hypothetical protein